MLDNIDSKSKVRPSILGSANKKEKLSLNLHTMPQTVTSHWKRWLVLGFLILSIFVLASYLLYVFTQ